MIARPTLDPCRPAKRSYSIQGGGGGVGGGDRGGGVGIESERVVVAGKTNTPVVETGALRIESTRRTVQ